jgi:hypothetical protein
MKVDGMSTHIEYGVMWRINALVKTRESHSRRRSSGREENRSWSSSAAL